MCNAFEDHSHYPVYQVGYSFFPTSLPSSLSTTKDTSPLQLHLKAFIAPEGEDEGEKNGAGSLYMSYNPLFFTPVRMEHFFHQFDAVLHQLVASPHLNVMDYILVTPHAVSLLPSPTVFSLVSSCTPSSPVTLSIPLPLVSLPLSL